MPNISAKNFLGEGKMSVRKRTWKTAKDEFAKEAWVVDRASAG